MSNSETPDRRRDARIAFRTVGRVNAVIPRHDREPIRVWTSDVSISGARLVSLEAIPEKEFLLELVLPQFKDFQLWCAVVDMGEIEPLTIRQQKQYEYRVKFVRMVERKQPTNEPTCQQK